MTFWYYLRVAPGELQPIALRKMDAFFRGRATLPAGGGAPVEYVRVKVAVILRTALAIEDIACERAPVLDDGRLDEAKWVRAAGAERVLATRGAVQRDPEAVVIDASARFEARRQGALARWEPTQADAGALRALVNRRAGWEML